MYHEYDDEQLVEGRNAVLETLKSHRTIEKILVGKGSVEGSINLIKALCKEKGIVVQEVDRKRLDEMSKTAAHQGVIAITTPFIYSEVEDILKLAEERGEKPFIVITDEIEDPHNLGSIIRTSECCGVHGIIIPKRRNVGVTPVVQKASAGAVEHMKIAKVSNINTTIDYLKEKGVWIYGTDSNGRDNCYNVNFDGPAAFVIGSEGKGIGRLTKEKCDMLIKIPLKGKVTSLNASVAAGIIIYEVMKGRIK